MIYEISLPLKCIYIVSSSVHLCSNNFISINIWWTTKMIVPYSIFALQLWDYGNSVHTTSSMIHLLPEPKPPLFYSSELCWAYSWEMASGKTAARVQNGIIGIKRKTVRQQRNATFCGCSVWSCNCSSLSQILFSFNPSLPTLLQVFPTLINANLCSLAGTKPAGRGPLPWLLAVRAGGVGGWGEGDLDRHLI